MQKAIDKNVKIKHDNKLVHNNALNFESLEFLWSVTRENRYITIKYKFKRCIT